MSASNTYSFVLLVSKPVNWLKLLPPSLLTYICISLETMSAKPLQASPSNCKRILLSVDCPGCPCEPFFSTTSVIESGNPPSPSRSASEVSFWFTVRYVWNPSFEYTRICILSGSKFSSLNFTLPKFPSDIETLESFNSAPSTVNATSVPSTSYVTVLPFTVPAKFNSIDLLPCPPSFSADTFIPGRTPNSSTNVSRTLTAFFHAFLICFSSYTTF